MPGACTDVTARRNAVRRCCIPHRPTSEPARHWTSDGAHEIHSIFPLLFLFFIGCAFYFIFFFSFRIVGTTHRNCHVSVVVDGEYLFADPESKLSKYAPKSWRSSHSHGLDANGRPALAFYFRVQFYVDSPLLLRDDTTRHHYYLQLRLNVASGAAAEHATHLAGNILFF